MVSESKFNNKKALYYMLDKLRCSPFIPQNFSMLLKY